MPLSDQEFLRRFEKQCIAALADCSRFPCEETCLRASGRLDGLLRGASLCLSTFHPDSESLLNEVRKLTATFQSELDKLQQSL